jgi:hypothetical protein
LDIITSAFDNLGKGGEVSCDRNEDATALVRVAPDGELPGPGFQHLVGVEARVFPQHRMSERGDQRLRRMAKGQVSRHQPCREINLSLPVECVEQSGPEGLLIGRQIVQLLVIRSGRQPSSTDA